MNDVKERPILFSGPMVRAILEGRKTQTRRALNRNKLYNGFAFDDPRIARACPYGHPGDRLWVRETWALVPATAYRTSVGVAQTINPLDQDDAAIYRAGWTRSEPGVRWRPSIHMPRWASRMALEITSVRVERIQQITLDDMRAEGVRPNNEASLLWRETLAENFQTLWDQINAKRGYSWESNPWVWVIEFKKVQP